MKQGAGGSGRGMAEERTDEGRHTNVINKVNKKKLHEVNTISSKQKTKHCRKNKTK